MIKFVKAGDVLPLRNEVLREGRLSLAECRYPTDNTAGAFHLGYVVNDQLVCIASFHSQTYEGYTGKAYQLRGMATVEAFRGKGLGNKLVNFAITYLRGQKVNYVWCNARKKAVRFYMGLGFEIISPEFEIDGIGPHYAMYVKIS